MVSSHDLKHNKCKVCFSSVSRARYRSIGTDKEGLFQPKREKHNQHGKKKKGSFSFNFFIHLRGVFPFENSDIYLQLSPTRRFVRLLCDKFIDSRLAYTVTNVA